MSINAKTARFELVTLDGKEALFHEDRVDPATVPEGMFRYEIRSGDYGVPVLLRRDVDTGFGGSILINEQLDVTDPEPYIEGGLAFTGQKCSLVKYMRDNPAQTTGMTKEEAVAKAEIGWWKEATAGEIVDFQLYEPMLCMPFDKFHEAVEEVLGRLVFTHEFAEVDKLRIEHEKIQQEQGVTGSGMTMGGLS